MGWWFLQLTVKILAFLPLTVIFFLLRLTKKLICIVFESLKLISLVVIHISGLWTILGRKKI